MKVLTVADGEPNQASKIPVPANCFHTRHGINTNNAKNVLICLQILYLPIFAYES